MSANVWRKCKLGDIANIYRGGNFQKNDFTPEGKPCIHYGQMYTHFGVFTDKVLTYLPEAVFKKSRIAVSNDVVMAITSETVEDVCSCVAWLGKDDIAISGHTVIIHHQQDAKFLSYYFHSDSFFTQKSRVAHGSKVIEMNPSDLEKTIIVLPQDIEEQKHISDILSTCDTVIHNTQKTIDKYKAIKQGMMQDLFTRGLSKDGKLRPSYKEAPELYKESELGMIPKEWEVKELKVLCNSIGDGLHGTPSYESNTELYFINGNNLDNGVINLSNAEEISEISYQKNKIDLSEKTLFLSINGTIGNVAFYNGEQILLGKSAAYINTRDINKYFLMYYIQTDYFSRYINKVLTGSTIQNLSLDSIRKMPVIDCEEQSEIAKRLSSIDSTIQKEEAILEKYKNIKTGLMARLLTPPDDAEIIDETGETL